MKKIPTFLIIAFTLIFLACSLVSKAQEASPEPPPDCTTDATLCMVPFDGGVFFLVFFAVGVGIYKIRRDRTKLKLVQ